MCVKNAYIMALFTHPSVIFLKIRRTSAIFRKCPRKLSGLEAIRAAAAQGLGIAMLFAQPAANGPAGARRILLPRAHRTAGPFAVDPAIVLHAGWAAAGVRAGHGAAEHAAERRFKKRVDIVPLPPAMGVLEEIWQRNEPRFSADFFSFHTNALESAPHFYYTGGGAREKRATMRDRSCGEVLP